MSAERMAAQRQRRGYRRDTGATASAGDSPGRFDAGQTVLVHVPLTFHQRRGRKVLVAPDGAGLAPLRASQSPTRTRQEVTPAVRALARAFRWRKLLETGSVATVQEIAAAEKINPSYISRVLRLTQLAPDIVEAILPGRQPEGMTLPALMEAFPVAWARQKHDAPPTAA